MDFFALSLPETSYLWMGLAVQAIVRSSSLRLMPGVIILLSTGLLVWRHQHQPDGWRKIAGYVASSLVLCVLFFPEAVIFGRMAPGRPTEPSQVASYAATMDAQAEVRTAEETGDVPDTLRAPALVPAGYRLLLRAVSETPLALAKGINAKTHRTLAFVAPLAWLLDTQLSADVSTAVADFTHNCYLPLMTQLMTANGGRLADDLVPWGDTLMHAALPRRTVTAGGQTGITWLQGPTSSNSVPCDVYLSAIEFKTQTLLAEMQSPRRVPLGEVYTQELALEGQQQAQLLVWRELLRAAGPGVPAPSLTAQYAALRGVSAVGGGVTQGLDAGVSSWLGRGFSLPKTLLGVASGGIKGLGEQFQRSLEGLTWLIGIAAFETWWAPYLVGMANLVLVGLFPFVLLLALFPGRALDVLIPYSGALLFTNATPLWFALVDLASRLATIAAPHGPDVPVLGSLVSWTTGQGWATMVTALGLLLIPLVGSFVFFATFRSIASAWRGI